jgi:hypothetical protein
MRNLFLTTLALAFCAASGCEGSGKAPSHHHEAAAQRFGELQQSGFNASREDVQAAFVECFPQGMEADKVNDLLATAMSENRGNGEIAYRWYPNGMERGYCLEVIVYGEPAVIQSAWVMTLPSM